MRIHFTTNAGQVASALDRTGKQARYASAKAINATVLDIQREQIQQQRSKFTVRRPGWMDKAVKITPFANKSSLTAVVRIDPPGNSDSALTQHEEGGTKRPRGKSLAIPDGARKNKAGIVTAGNRPRALQFVAHGTSGRVMKGDKRTVMIRDASGRGTIFRRKGKGKRSELVKVFNLVPQGRLIRRLGFVANATRTAEAKYVGHFQREYAKALATAK